MKWGRWECTWSNPLTTTLPWGEGLLVEGEVLSLGGSGSQVGPPALTPLSPPSSSSAWPRPRLPPHTSSASTGNRCRGVTPRAEASQGRPPLPPPPASKKPAGRPWRERSGYSQPPPWAWGTGTDPTPLQEDTGRVVHSLNEATHSNSPRKPRLQLECAKPAGC